MSISAPATTDKALRMSYRIARGEQGVLTFEPYKSLLLPLWRFRTPSIARQSSASLYERFQEYDCAGDFVGMDMCRKFIQMGMTRAKRYANYRGGRKYDRGSGRELERSGAHEGREEKAESSEVFREAWGRCRAHEGYRRRKEEFLGEQRVWDRERRGREREREREREKERERVDDGVEEEGAGGEEDNSKSPTGRVHAEEKDGLGASRDAVKRSRRKRTGGQGSHA